MTQQFQPASRAGDNDPVLPEAEVLAVVRRHVPSAQRVTTIDESGRKARAYIIDDAIVLKTHRPVRLRARAVEEFDTDLAKEARFLEQLGSDTAIRTPRLLGSGSVRGVPYVCMTRVRGVTLRQPELPTEIRERALRDLGRLLRRIHALPQAPLQASGLFPQDGPGEALTARLTALCDRLVAAMDELPEEWQTRLSARAIAERALAALPSTEERVALHSNPAGEHVFVDPDTGELMGLIDFGDAYISHPALDLRPWRDPADRAAVLAGYIEEAGPLPASFLATWRVGLIIGELAALLRRRVPPAHAEENLRDLLSELEGRQALNPN